MFTGHEMPSGRSKVNEMNKDYRELGMTRKAIDLIDV